MYVIYIFYFFLFLFYTLNIGGRYYLPVRVLTYFLTVAIVPFC